MKTGEIIKQLIIAKNYVEMRNTVSDEFIDFVKLMMPRDYEYFKEKEETYQEFHKILAGSPPKK